MRKKIIFIISTITIIALVLSMYVAWQKRNKFQPTLTYSICVWGDTTAKVTIQYIAKDKDTNKIVEEKDIFMVRKQSEHALEKWNMIAIKPAYFVDDTHIPFEIKVSTQNKSRVYVAVFDNEKMPYWGNDSFLVFHLLMLRSAYDNNPDVAQKSLEEFLEKSPFLKDKNDSLKNSITQALWHKVQTIDRDSIAHYLQDIHYPLFQIIEPQTTNFVILKK